MDFLIHFFITNTNRGLLMKKIILILVFLSFSGNVFAKGRFNIAFTAVEGMREKYTYVEKGELVIPYGLLIQVRPPALFIVEVGPRLGFAFGDTSKFKIEITPRTGFLIRCLESSGVPVHQEAIFVTASYKNFQFMAIPWTTLSRKYYEYHISWKFFRVNLETQFVEKNFHPYAGLSLNLKNFTLWRGWRLDEKGDAFRIGFNFKL